MSQPPQHLGKFRVVERVARGPLADVLKVRLDGIAGFSRLFALKHVHPEVAERPEAVTRVEAEAREAASLAHGNIVQVLDLGREDDRLFLVLEWVDGWSLATLLDHARLADRPLPPALAAWLGVQVLKALEYAHGVAGEQVPAEGPRTMVHAALCAGNVLVSRAGDVKVADFGLGRAATELSGEAASLVPPRLERASPELLSGGTVGPAADVFAVGTVLYEGLTLCHPFRAGGPEAIRAAVLAGAKPVTDIAPDLPGDLADAVDTALAVDPAARHASATVMKDLLTQVLHGQVIGHEDLAVWVRAVMGIAEAPPESVTGYVELELEAGPPDDLLGEPERDVDIELPDLSERDDRTAPAPRSDVADDDDARTQVQGVAAPAKKAHAPAKEWDAVGAAAVHPDVAARLAELRRTHTSAGDASQRPSAAVDPMHDAEDAEPPRPWIGGALVAGGMLAAGVLLGTLASAVVGLPDQFTVLPPALDVRTTPGVPLVVRVDGAAIEGPTELEPGAHEVRVEIAGVDPWVVDLTLQPGEYRVMVVEASQLQPSSTRAAAEAADAD